MSKPNALVSPQLPMTSEAVDGKSMQELSVTVLIAEGEDLTLGIRSGSLKGNGTQPTGTNRTGKFRVDYFRIERLSGDEADGIASPSESYQTYRPYKTYETYDLLGRKVSDNPLPKGIYIRNGKKIIVP